MTEYSQQQWLDKAAEQPELPSELPAWLRDFTTIARTGRIQDAIGDESRAVPDRDAKGNPPRYSAVLVLVKGESTFVAKEDLPYPTDAAMLLTHRAPSMRQHSGQIAFPGGQREPQDSGPVMTALREAQEETGLNPDHVQPLAVMEPIYIDRSNFAVVPVLAYLAGPSTVYPASSENDWVAMVPIEQLTDPALRYWLTFSQWKGPAFDVHGMVLWGFTGAVVTALLDIAGWSRPWGEDSEPVELFEALKNSANKEAMGTLKESFRQAGDSGGAP